MHQSLLSQVRRTAENLARSPQMASAEAYSWGWGKDGQLGHGDRRSEKRPALIEFLEGSDLLQIACGGWHSAALTNTGEVFTWGSGRCGQLGHGDWASHRLPCVVHTLQGKEIAQVASCSPMGRLLT